MRGRELRLLRERAGVTAGEIAYRLKYRAPSISLIEREMADMPEGFAEQYRRILIEITGERHAAAQSRCA